MKSTVYYIYVLNPEKVIVLVLVKEGHRFKARLILCGDFLHSPYVCLSQLFQFIFHFTLQTHTGLG